MIKRIHIFLLFLKIDENNSYMFSKNYFLFHFIFKNYLQKTIVKQYYKFLFSIFKNKKLFLNYTTKRTLKFNHNFIKLNFLL